MALSITKATGKARSQLVGLQGLQRLGEEDQCFPQLQSSQSNRKSSQPGSNGLGRMLRFFLSNKLYFGGL